jgi:hypothetical protein
MVPNSPGFRVDLRVGPLAPHASRLFMYLCHLSLALIHLSCLTRFASSRSPLPAPMYVCLRLRLLCSFGQPCVPNHPCSPLPHFLDHPQRPRSNHPCHTPHIHHTRRRTLRSRRLILPNTRVYRCVDFRTQGSAGSDGWSGCFVVNLVHLGSAAISFH